MTSISQLPPLAEQRAALNAAWLQMERAEAERELLMELLRECYHLAYAVAANPEIQKRIGDSRRTRPLHYDILAILRGKPVAEVLRPDEDPDMADLPF